MFVQLSTTCRLFVGQDAHVTLSITIIHGVHSFRMLQKLKKYHLFLAKHCTCIIQKACVTNYTFLQIFSHKLSIVYEHFKALLHFLTCTIFKTIHVNLGRIGRIGTTNSKCTCVQFNLDTQIYSR